MSADSLLSLTRIETSRLELLWRVLVTLPAKTRVGESHLPGGEADELTQVLAPVLGQPAWLLATLIEAVLAERGRLSAAPSPTSARHPEAVGLQIDRHYGDSSPELVWSGSVASPTTRMTRWVIEDLFRHASQSVLIAGYSFDGARDLFAPLFARADALEQEGHPAPRVRIILDCSRIADPSHEVDPELLARKAAKRFLETCWAEPTSLRPELRYYVPSTRREPSRVPGRSAFAPNSMHAKCIVVDRSVALVGSANFSSRARDNRDNVEVGALIRDHHFVESLLAAWHAIEGQLRPVPE